MPQNFLRNTFLASIALLLATTASSRSHATTTHITAGHAAIVSAGPGGSGDGGDPNPCELGCVVRAL